MSPAQIRANHPQEAAQFNHLTIEGRKAYLTQLNLWRDSQKKTSRRTRKIESFCITPAILLVPSGLPVEWRRPAKRVYRSVREARREAGVYVDLQQDEDEGLVGQDAGQDGVKDLIDAEAEKDDEEDKYRNDEVEDEDEDEDEDYAAREREASLLWLKQLARIQFLATGELNEETYYLHLPKNMQTLYYHNKMHGSWRELSRILCSEKGLALVIFALNTREFLVPSPTNPTLARYPFSIWSDRLDFWNSLLVRYPMMLIFWAQEAFPVLDLAFIFGRAPKNYYGDLRSRMQVALRWKAAFAFEIVWRGFCNVDPEKVTSRNREGVFWKWRTWVTPRIRHAMSNKTSNREEYAVPADAWPVIEQRVYNANKIDKGKPWSKGVVAPGGGDGEVVEFQRLENRFAEKGKEVVKEVVKGDSYGGRDSGSGSGSGSDGGEGSSENHAGGDSGYEEDDEAE